MSKPTEQLRERTNELDNLLKQLEDAINQSQIDDSDKTVFIKKIRSISNLDWPLEYPWITNAHRSTIRQICSDIGSYFSDYLIETGNFSEQNTKIFPLQAKIELCLAGVLAACHCLREMR